MKRQYALALSLLVICAGSVTAQESNPVLTPIPTDTAVRIGVLSNGLTYYIRHNAKPENQGEFFIVHNVGAIQEEDSQQGLAHFLEHMAFNGTENLPGKTIIEYLESIGVKFGVNLNAGTGRELTTYRMSDVPLTREGIIDTALLILHDWSRYISLRPEEIDKERGVIVEELRARNSAQWRVDEKSAPALYNHSKYADRNVIGSIEGLKGFSHDELRNFYKQWYRPDLQAVIIVGDFDPAEMETKVKKVFSTIPASENPTPKQVVTIPGNEKPIVDIITDPELTTTGVAVYIKYEPLPREYRNTILAEMNEVLDRYLILMANERLTDLLQRTDAPFVSGYLTVTSLSNTCDALLGQVTARNGEASGALEALSTELEKMRRFGFTQSEFDRARANLLRYAKQRYDNRKDMRNIELAGRYMSSFVYNTSLPTEELRWELDSNLISTLDLATINMFVQSRITPENRVIIVTSPDKTGVAVPTREEITGILERVEAAELQAGEDSSVDRPLIPDPSALKGSKIATTETDKFGATVWTLENGATVVFLPTDFKNDEVVFRAKAFGGTSLLCDAWVQPGQTLPIIMESSGVGAFSMPELDKRLAGKALYIYPTVDDYTAGFEGMASPSDLETLFQLLYLHYTAPRFTEEDLKITADRYRAIFENMSSNPEYIRRDTLIRTFYGDNPRKQVISAATFDRLELDDIRSIYRRLYADPASFTFTVAGNVPTDTLRGLVEKYIGSLPASTEKPQWKDNGERMVTGRIAKRFSTPMQMPKATVVEVYSGAMPYTLENLLALNTLAQILTIRYTESIREEKGGSYGVGVIPAQYYMPEETYDLFIAFDTDPQKVDDLAELVGSELKLIAANGPRPEDLDKAKEYLTKQHPEDLKKNKVWLGYLDVYHRAGLDLKSNYEDIVASLNVETIKDLAGKILSDGNLVTVIQEPAVQN